MSALAHVTIAPGYWLAPDAAASYARMRAAGCPAGITSAGRTRAEQADLWRRQGAQGLAAPPDSPTAYHQQGIAIDLPEPARAWVRVHGREHGWTFPLPREPWHTVYTATHDQHAHTTTPTQEDDDMPESPETQLNVFEIRKYLGHMEAAIVSAIDRLTAAITQAQR